MCAAGNAGTGDAVLKTFLERAERGWRVFATGLSFLMFGIGGVVLPIVFFNTLNLVVRKRLLRNALAREIIRKSFALFVLTMRSLGVLTYEFRGRDRLNQQGMLILANHPTLLDTVFLMALVKNANCIVKNKLLRNPFTRGPVRAAGYISNDSGPALVDECITSLKQGSNLIVFPEGTRTETPDKLQFKRGAANIAVRGGCDITPVFIRCTPLTLRKGEHWWQVPAVKMHFDIEVHESLAVQGFLTDAGSEVLAARKLTEYLQDYFMRTQHLHAD